MDILWQELSFGFGDGEQLIRVLIRLIAAGLLGGLIGYEREMAGKDAGLRTHILVTMGTCVMVLAGTGYGMNSDGVSRIIQGIVTGIGFIGAGSILKLDDRGDIRGLTSSAGIWMTTGIGISVGLGELGLAVLATILALLVLTIVTKMEPDPEKEISAKK